MKRSSPTPSEQLGEMIGAYRISQLLYVAARLEIADILEQGAKTHQQLAKAVAKRTDIRVDEQALYRIMRALASAQVFKEPKTGRFENSSLSRLLIKDAPDSLRDTALMAGVLYYKAWEALVLNAMNGKNAFKQVYGDPFFEYLNKNPTVSKTFDATMTQRAPKRNAAVARACLKAGVFQGVSTIVDVGGGCGRLLVTLLATHPADMYGLVVDRDSVIRNARYFGRKDGTAKEVRKRYKCSAGDFFKSVPRRKNASYVLAEVLHDWDDPKAAEILRNCNTAMSKGAKLVIIEQVVPGPKEPSRSKLTDVHMMVLTGGRERTIEEFKGLLSSCGFMLERNIPTQSWVSVIVARKT